MCMKAVKVDLDLEDAQRHIDNLFDVRLYLAGGGLFPTARAQELADFCTEAMEFLLKVKGFGDEITRAVHGQ